MARSELLWSSQTFSVYREESLLPDGRLAEYDIIRRPAIAAVVAMPGPDSVILIHQYRHIARGPIWEIPAGKVTNETPESCGIRELEEEAGYRAGKLQLLGAFHVEPGGIDQTLEIFLATDLAETRQRCEPDEFIVVHDMPLRRALEMVGRREIIDAKSVLALFLANAFVNQ